MKGDIYSENEYCAYNLKQKDIHNKYRKVENPDGLFALADCLIKCGIYQEAALILARLVELEPDNERALYKLGDRNSAVLYMEKAASILGIKQIEYVGDLRAMQG